MIETVFRSDELPPGERLARFDALQVASEHPMRMLSGEPASFSAELKALDLDAVNLVELTCSPSEVLRTPRLVRAADPELYSVVFALRGSLDVEQAGRSARLGPYGFALYDSSRPFRIGIDSDSRTATLLRLHLPRVLLGLPRAESDRLLAVGMSGREGMGALLTQFVTGLTAASAVCRPGDVTRLGGIAVDLLTATLAHQLDAEERVPEESRQRALLVRIDAFVRRNLHETGLSPATVAAAHHISVSHLHRLFETRDTTVSAWIRHLRLERAQRDLPIRRCGPNRSTASRPAAASATTPPSPAPFAPRTTCRPATTGTARSARRRPTVKRAGPTVRQGHRPRGPARWCPPAIR